MIVIQFLKKKQQVLTVFTFFSSHVERELLSLNKKYVAKDEEYSKASDGLEKELSKLKHQMSVMSKENTKLTKDKENLLEEVRVKVKLYSRCLY